MTNMRLLTCMFDDIHFCPFCGEKLREDGNGTKHCGFHIRLYRADVDEEDRVE